MYPHVTVATVVEKDGKFLFVKEKSGNEIVINQPAGHLELGESLCEAAVRETLEETQWHVKLSGFLGVSQYLAPSNQVTYIRHSFIAQAVSFDAQATLDKDIIEAIWLTPEEAQQQPLRSPMVALDLQHYLQGKIYDLSLVSNIDA